MVEAGFSISGIASIPNAVSGGRLRPARAEDGVAPLLWEAEAPPLPALPLDHGMPTMPLLPMAGPAPLGWQMPGWDAFLWAPPPWAPAPWAPTPWEPASWEPAAWAAPERHSAPDDIRLPPGLLPDAPAWLPPATEGRGPERSSPLPVVLEPPAKEPAGAEPGPVAPRPPALPEPLFPSPVLEGGAAREVSVPEGLEDAIHQPGVTDRPAEGLGWRITGGADAALLLMDPSSGMLRFLTAPDFERPADADGDSRYEVIFEVRDGWGTAATQRLTIAIEDSIWA